MKKVVVSLLLMAFFSLNLSSQNLRNDDANRISNPKIKKETIEKIRKVQKKSDIQIQDIKDDAKEKIEDVKMNEKKEIRKIKKEAKFKSRKVNDNTVKLEKKK